jgi:hypothetical protein
VTAALVDASPIMRRVEALRGWIGAGRPLTASGHLRPADVPAALTALGLPAPRRRVRSATDFAGLRHAWIAALAARRIVIAGSRVVAPGGTDAEALEAFWAALEAVLR